MYSDTVLGLPAFLRLLATHPDGQRLAFCLNDGPFAAFGARATSLWLLEEREILSLYGYAGLSERELERWHKIPLTVESQMVEVVRNNEVIVTPTAEFASTYPNATFDRERFDAIMERVGGGDVVGIPVVHQGLCLGVAQFTTAVRRAWHSLDFSVLDGISSALGLWATHPQTPISPLYVSSGSNPMLVLTDRQKDIVRLVTRGVGNHQIAQELLVSVSTVKQDLQRVMRATNQSDRLAAARCAIDMGLLAPPPPR